MALHLISSPSSSCQVIQSKKLATRRSSRNLSPEDLLFLIRYDRAKVNRLRTYLSWKDVRKKAKDSEPGAGGAEPEVEAEDVAGEHSVVTRSGWRFGLMISEGKIRKTAHCLIKKPSLFLSLDDE